MTNTKEAARLLLCAVVGGAVAALTLWLFQGHKLMIWPEEVSYPDLIAVLLTGLSLLLALFGLGLAVFGFWGYSQLRKMIAELATTAASQEASAKTVEHLNDEIRSGETGRRIEALVKTQIASLLGNKATFAAWLEQYRHNAAAMDDLDLQSSDMRAAEAQQTARAKSWTQAVRQGAPNDVPKD